MEIRAFLITVFAAITLPASAKVQPNSLFSDNAVLQRDKEIPVRGTARDGEKVTVEFAGQKVFTVARDGKWKVLLKPMRANATPQTMVIIGDNTVTLTNVLVGDVWVASGQSNMERQPGLRAGEPPIVNWEAEVAAANYPLIHELYVPENFAFTPVADANGFWNSCSPRAVKDFSAVGYFFARGIFKAEKIPIGILFTAVGGTPAESWTSAHTLEAMPDLENNVKVMQEMRETAATPRDDRINRWYEANDPGSKEDWQSSELPLTNWDSTTLPGMT